MRIGDLAKKVNVNPKTIRYYEEIGLLPPPKRTPSRYREYTDDDGNRLQFIRNAQAFGIALKEIREVLAFRDHGAYPCPYVLSLIATKIKEIESQIKGLRMLAGDLKRLQATAASIPAETLAARVRFCHILENQQLLQIAPRPPARRPPAT
ncbi:MAG: heavy metal-responsive transcriptional regulator [Armatimonadetes bacterium]|nr:heavy metal-responsive transcriptional regulator [Armatimonadota bacterium]